MGDVNGDGFGDIMAGAAYYDNGEGNEGRALLFFGNSGDGTDAAFAMVPQARQPGTTTTIPPGGVSNGCGSATDLGLCRITRLA